MAFSIAAYLFLSIFVILRLFIKKRDRGAICRSSAMFLCMLISIADLIWVALDHNRKTSWLMPIFNCTLILLFVRAIREVWI